mmetsp:Transcript_31453/g.59906  ORF Transcript_31453/g.59906 Transcript_31453/m.59906 type:complete len:80 (-) Transcript_31453:779-1018(-)
MSVSSSPWVEACSMIVSGVERTMCSAVGVVDSDVRDDGDNSGELARDCTLAIRDAVEENADVFGFDDKYLDRIVPTPLI